MPHAVTGIYYILYPAGQKCLKSPALPLFLFPVLNRWLTASTLAWSSCLSMTWSNVSGYGGNLRLQVSCSSPLMRNAPYWQGWCAQQGILPIFGVPLLPSGWGGSVMSHGDLSATDLPVVLVRPRHLCN